jgi:hypothetical protein
MSYPSDEELIKWIGDVSRDDVPVPLDPDGEVTQYFFERGALKLTATAKSRDTTDFVWAVHFHGEVLGSGTGYASFLAAGPIMAHRLDDINESGVATELAVVCYHLKQRVEG